MPETESVKVNNKNLAEADSKGFSLLGKLDGQTIIQSVVMSELLGKPKAKTRKRGYFKYEGTHSR